MSTPMCSATHCSGISTQINETCKKNGWTVGHLILICDPVTGDCCNCTCSCFAWGTEILIPDNKFKVIQDFKIGDPVMVCGPDLKWETRKVEYSHGTDQYGRQPMMLHMIYGEDKKEIIITMDHLFLVPEGKLKRADKLIVGKDFLVSPDGQKVEIVSIEVGAYQGGVHHIATSVDKPQSLDGHLLASQGIVSADFAVQTHYQHGELDPEKFLVKGHEDIPQVQHQDIKSSHSNVTEQSKFAGSFTPHSESRIVIPDHARTFFTEVQAHELGKKAPLYPIGNSVNNQAVEYLFTIFRAFYPKIHFAADHFASDFNAYSWKNEDGKMFVVVSGGLMRVISLELAGFALVIGHEVGHLLGDPDENGHVCEGTADFYSVGYALRKVFFQSLYAEIYSELLPQIKETFGYITSKGKDKSCRNLNLDCRYSVYTAAGALTNMPECAGGPEALALDTAINTADGVLLTFNTALNAGTAQTIKNYQVEGLNNDLINPVVTNAIYTESKPKEVLLKVEGLETDDTYKVTVANLISAEGEDLNPQKKTADFTA
jgi:hypothetical protein